MKVIISVGGKFHAFHLARQLQKRGFLERIITAYPWFKLAKEGLAKVKVVSLPKKEIIHKLLNSLFFLNNRINPDYYLHSLFDRQASKYIEPCDIFVGWSGFSLYTLRKAKSLGTVTVLERNSTHIEYQRDILKEESERLGIKIMLPHPYVVEKELAEYQEADYISVPSQFVKKTFLEKGIAEEKIIQVPFGVDIQALRPVPKEDDIFRIVYVGGMTIRKGIHYLLEAASKLKFKNYELWLIGSMSTGIKPFFKKYKGCFKYLGHIDYNLLYKYYSQSSVFVLASIEEGLATVILQALACGLPVICTTNSGGEDIVRNGIDGFVIPIRDIEILKEKIVYFYENPTLCKTMGQSARERVSNNFTWDDYGNRIVDAYLNLLK